MTKQSDTILTALVVDDAGALDVAWLNVAAGTGWAGPQPISSANIAPPGAPIGIVNQTSTITSALVADNNGALDVFWLDTSSGTGWAGPSVITSNGVAPRGAHVAMGKHLEKSCGGHEQQCCSQTGCDDPHDVCDGPGGFSNTTDPRNTCQCGGDGETCCAGNTCGPSLTCKGGSCTCGWSKGDPCCTTPDPGNGGVGCFGALQCSSGGTCTCGGPGEVCCAGNACNDGGTCAKASDGFLRCPMPCGGDGQSCCAGNTCNAGSGLTCQSNHCAHPSGACNADQFTQCAVTSVPPGYITTQAECDMPTCDMAPGVAGCTRTLDTLVQYVDWPQGGLLDVCMPQTVPDGWQTVGPAFYSHACGNGYESNTVTIQRVSARTTCAPPQPHCTLGTDTDCNACGNACDTLNGMQCKQLLGHWSCMCTNHAGCL
jgi:hypothetical protein